MTSVLEVRPRRWRNGDPTVQHRLERRSTLRPDGCWTWNGCVNSRGYGCISNGYGRVVLVHRLAYELFIGELVEGLQIDHTCHNADPICEGGTTCAHRRCWRPDHLEQVTGKVNRSRVGPPSCRLTGLHRLTGLPHTDWSGVTARVCHRCGTWVPIAA